MRCRTPFAIAGFLALVSVAGLGWRIWSFRPVPSELAVSPWPEVRGALHVHSHRSDGAGDLDQIASAAGAAGLDFVVLTDHRDIEALGRDEYRKGVLILKGVEISTEAGHVLALDAERPDFRFDGDPESVFTDVFELGGFSVVAHPVSPHPERRFHHEGTPLFDAVEIWNGSEDLRNISFRAIAGSVASLLNPRYGLLRSLHPSSASLRFWDEALSESQGRPIAAFAGSDAHGGIRLPSGRFLRFPNYQHLFELVSNHLILEEALTGAVARDRRLVMEALRGGRAFVAFDAVAPARGFVMKATSANGLSRMGERVDDLPVVLTIEAPLGPVEIVVFRNGSEVGRTKDLHLTLEIDEPGIYRAEVFFRGETPLDRSIPWIVSNPIYVAMEEPRDRFAPAAPIPGAGSLVEDFEEALEGAWRSEADGRSRMSPAFLDGPGAEGSRQAIAFDFFMGDGLSPEERSHCVLTGPVPDGLEDARGISFFHRANGVFRFDLQLRDENAASPDGIEPWRVSLKTSTEWKRAYVSFDDLKSYHPRSDGRFDAGAARGLAFYLDTATVRPGASGRVWIDSIRLHR